MKNSAKKKAGPKENHKVEDQRRKKSKEKKFRDAKKKSRHK